MWLLPNDSGLGSIAKLSIWLCYCRFLLNFVLFWVNPCPLLCISVGLMMAPSVSFGYIGLV